MFRTSELHRVTIYILARLWYFSQDMLRRCMLTHMANKASHYFKWNSDQAELFGTSFGRVWHDTAIPFTDVLNSFESWMEGHSLYDPKNPSKLVRAAFVTW